MKCTRRAVNCNRIKLRRARQLRVGSGLTSNPTTLVTLRYTRSLRTPPLSDAPLEGLVSAAVAKSLARTSYSPRTTHLVMPNRCIRSLERIGSDEPLRDVVRWFKKRGGREGKGKAAPPTRLCVCYRPTISSENTETALRRSSLFPFLRRLFTNREAIKLPEVWPK